MTDVTLKRVNGALGLAGSDAVVGDDVGPAGADGRIAQDAPQRRWLGMLLDQ